jgi:hypothetical protein
MAVAMDAATGDERTMADNEAAKSTHILHDSMVTVRLSEPPSLTLVTQTMAMGALHNRRSRNEEMDTLSLNTADLTPQDIEHVVQSRPARPSAFIASADEISALFPAPVEEEPSMEDNERRGSESTEDSTEGEVNWAELEKTEEQEPRDQDSEDVCCRLPKSNGCANSLVHCSVARQT